MVPPERHCEGVGGDYSDIMIMQTIARDERQMSSPLQRQAPLGRAAWPSEFLRRMVLDLDEAIRSNRIQPPVGGANVRKWGG